MICASSAGCTHLRSTIKPPRTPAQLLRRRSYLAGSAILLQGIKCSAKHGIIGFPSTQPNRPYISKHSAPAYSKNLPLDCMQYAFNTHTVDDDARCQSASGFFDMFTQHKTCKTSAVSDVARQELSNLSKAWLYSKFADCMILKVEARSVTEI